MSQSPTDPTFQPYDRPQLAKLVAAVQSASHPTQIGPYTILELIGEGGMGSVYKAEQAAPLRRIVALKLIKLGMDTRDVIARFESERQALALMNHPNVARVYDAGATENGRPYFVMEYVAGQPITDFADAHALSIPQRLELFTQACSAVQHAHQKAIIHRDLKPSNILVTLDGSTPTVKVIDFGIARAIDRDAAEQVTFTETGLMLGTPEYMSPEQAVIGRRDVDTRSDVYSLGVVLYELLAGALPFDGKALRSAGYHEIQRVIREVDPPRPSTRLSELGQTAQDVARNRQLSLDHLERQLSGDLEWIPLMAMRKEPARRYATAAELSEDITNYLSHRPLRAAPESTAYRIRKFLRRNRRTVAAAAIMLLLLVAGAVTTSWQAYRATYAERDTRSALAEVQRQKKQTDAVNASLDDVNNFLARDVLGSADPEVTRGKPLTVLDALDNAARTIKGRFPHDPRTEAAIHTALSDAYRSLGRVDLAVSHSERAAELSGTLSNRDDPVAINASRSLALGLNSKGDLKRAEALARDAVERASRVYGPESELALRAMQDLGVLLGDTERLDEAEAISRRVVDAYRKRFGDDDAATINAVNTLVNVLYNRSKLAEAEKLASDNLQVCRRSLGDDHPDTIMTMMHVGQMQSVLGKFAEAEALDAEGVTLSRRVNGEENYRTLSFINNLGEVLQLQGKLVEAEARFRESLPRMRKMLGSDTVQTQAVVNNLARVLNSLKKWDEAEPLYREAFETGRKIHGGLGHPDVLISGLNYARALSEHKRLHEAELIDREALAAAKEKLSADHRITMVLMQDLGEVLHKQGNHTEAEPLLRESLALRRKNLGDDSPDTRGSLRALGQFLLDEQRYAEAEPITAECYQRSINAKMAPIAIATNVSQWGICLTRLGKYDQAAAPLLEAYKRLDAAGLRKSDPMIAVIGALAEVAEHTDKPEEATSRRAELEALRAATRPTTISATTQAADPKR